MRKKHSKRLRGRVTYLFMRIFSWANLLAHPEGGTLGRLEADVQVIVMPGEELDAGDLLIVEQDEV